MPHEPAPVTGRPPAPTEPFERLFMAEYGKVVAVAHRVLTDRTEAEDVAQEVFIDFHRKHRPDASYAGAWLHRAAVHTALNRIRSRRRRERRELVDARTQDRSVVDPQDIVEVEEDRRLVRELRHSGLSYVEVGAALGVGAGQIGTLLRRAEQALRKEMNSATPV
jgi:DNA-directed RNA polymerase specialized sigma24 family protein